MQKCRTIADKLITKPATKIMRAKAFGVALVTGHSSWQLALLFFQGIIKANATDDAKANLSLNVLTLIFGGVVAICAYNIGVSKQVESKAADDENKELRKVIKKIEVLVDKKEDGDQLQEVKKEIKKSDRLLARRQILLTGIQAGKVGKISAVTRKRLANKNSPSSVDNVVINIPKDTQTAEALADADLCAAQARAEALSKAAEKARTEVKAAQEKVDRFKTPKRDLDVKEEKKAMDFSETKERAKAESSATGKAVIVATIAASPIAVPLTRASKFLSLFRSSPPTLPAEASTKVEEGNPDSSSSPVEEKKRVAPLVAVISELQVEERRSSVPTKTLLAASSRLQAKRSLPPIVPGRAKKVVPAAGASARRVTATG